MGCHRRLGIMHRSIDLEMEFSGWFTFHASRASRCPLSDWDAERGERQVSSTIVKRLAAYLSFFFCAVSPSLVPQNLVPSFRSVVAVFRFSFPLPITRSETGEIAPIAGPCFGLIEPTLDFARKTTWSKPKRP